MTAVFETEILDPSIPREVINYSLQRRASVEDLKSGRVLKTDLCDADTYLKRAARFHGIKTNRS